MASDIYSVLLGRKEKMTFTTKNCAESGLPSDLSRSWWPSNVIGIVVRISIALSDPRRCSKLPLYGRYNSSLSPCGRHVYVGDRRRILVEFRGHRGRLVAVAVGFVRHPRVRMHRR